MKRRNLINKILVGSWAMLAITLAYAGTPLWTFKPLTTTTRSISANDTVTVQYQITNQSRKSHTLVMTAIPGITQEKTAGNCPSPFSLTYQQSCTLTLQVNGSSLAGNVVGGPEVCQQGNALQCYQPSQANQLSITRTSTPPITVPGTPTITTTIAGNGAVTVSWTAPSSDGGSPITGYMVISSPGNHTCTTTGATTCTVPGLTNGTPYTFTVTATNARGTGQASSSSSSVTPSNKANQTITYTSTAPSATAGGATYTPTATSTSGLVVSITVHASSGGICSISDGVVSFNAVGTCILDANQAGNLSYYAATQVQQAVTVGVGSQTITYTSTAPSAAAGGATYTPTATSNSGLVVSITVDASTGGICSISDGVVSFNAVGTCTLDANQTGNTNYNAAPQVQQNIVVAIPLLSTSTLVYSSLNPSTTSSSVTLTAKVSSGGGTPTGTVGFTANGTTISGCGSQALSSGNATCSTSSLTSAGTYAIVATYTPTGAFGTSTSPNFNQYVATTITDTVPAAPTDVVVAPGAGQVSVSWFPPANTGGEPITGYTVFYGTTASGLFTTPGCTTTGALSCTVSGLTNTTPYTFIVTATNAIGPGPTGYSSSVIPDAALSASPSNLALSVAGRTRTISITNNSASEVTITDITYPTWPSGTSATSTCTATLAAGASCSITVTPGSTATSGAGPSACTTGIPPTPDVITITTDVTTLTATVVVLGYGCQYQEGYVYSIDDTTPLTSSIGGKVVSLTDQSSSIYWSSDFVSIWGIAEPSTIANPSPNASSGQPAILDLGQLNCNGSNDGACATNNMFVHYGTGSYAVGLCKAPINNYTDWYLPAICEMGGASQGAGCLSGLDNIDTNLVQLGISGLSGSYWSSTEFSGNPVAAVWREIFASGGGSTQGNTFKTNVFNGVRCSRALTL